MSIVKPQINLFEDGSIIHNCVKNEIAVGHTAGHVICTIFSEGEELIAINDLVLDELVITHPNWGSGFDGNFEQAKSTRKNILRQLSEKKSLIWGSHLSYPGIGYIKNWYRRLGRRDISIFGKWKKDFIWEQTQLNFTDASRAMKIVMNIYQN